MNNPAKFSKYLEKELRSDHAGETGAVFIYKGIACIAKLTKDTVLLELANHHGATESEHLRLIESILPEKMRSKLLVLWRLAGWLIGALPALFGRKAVFATIAAVETFVEKHYQAQIDHIETYGAPYGLLGLLRKCQADEIAHKIEAIASVSKDQNFILNLWCSIVGWGSSSAVVVARVV